MQTTTADRQEAERIADVLLSRRLAACVQLIGPIQSRYWWHGEREEAEEWLCLAKTTGDRTTEVAEAIASTHSYETPEIIVTAVVYGSPAYLRWLAGEVHAARRAE